MKPIVALSKDLGRSQGYFIVTVSGLENHIDRVYYSISRSGHDQNYVGESRWQKILEWLEPADARYESGTLKLVIPPTVSSQMEPQDYSLALKAYPSAEEIFVDFNWPAEISSSESLNSLELQAEFSDTDMEAHHPVEKSPTVETTPKPVKKLPVQDQTLPTFESKTKKSIEPGKAAFIGLLFVFLIMGVVYWILMSMTPSVEETPVPVAEPEIQVDSTKSEDSQAEPSAYSSIKNNPARQEESKPDSQSVPEVMIEPTVEENLDEPEQSREVVKQEPASDETVDKLKALLSNGEAEEQQDDNAFQSIEPALRETLNE